MLNEQLYGKVVNFYDLDQEEVRPGVKRSAYSTDEVMLVMNVLTQGMDLRPHVHEDFDQLAMVTRGEADYYLEDTPHRLREGSMLLVPAGTYHHAVPVSDEVHNLDLFFPPRGDYQHLVDYVRALA
ncbi:MAG: cupin domain-containing protein [Actinomycetota bacterium]|nr:cupin domain-containing protein [Actinomycetota bacterium]